MKWFLWLNIFSFQILVNFWFCHRKKIGEEVQFVVNIYSKLQQTLVTTNKIWRFIGVRCHQFLQYLSISPAQPAKTIGKSFESFRLFFNFNTLKTCFYHGGEEVRQQNKINLAISGKRSQVFDMELWEPHHWGGNSCSKEAKDMASLLM